VDKKRVVRTNFIVAHAHHNEDEVDAKVFRNEAESHFVGNAQTVSESANTRGNQQLIARMKQGINSVRRCGTFWVHRHVEQIFHL